MNNTRIIRLWWTTAIGIILCLPACQTKKIPDVSGIQISFTVQRFEKDFFSLDTLALERSLNGLYEQYPGFFPQYIVQILGLDPKKDSAAFAENVIRFIRDYRPIYDSAVRILGNLGDTEKELRDGLQRVHYYFPSYRLPTALITFIGPMDALFTGGLGAYGDILTEQAVGAGLQLHLGSGFSSYHSAMGQSLYPDYISRRFTPQTIAVNSLKNIIDDIYQEQAENKVLVDQMVEKGKRLYVLDLLMPHTADTLKIGYTAAEWKGCVDNEGKIWNFFVTNNLLMNNDPMIMQRFVNDGPFTPELGEGSPGYIGLFVGWQIVKAYMANHPTASPAQLLKTPARTIFEESKYRPK